MAMSSFVVVQAAQACLARSRSQLPKALPQAVMYLSDLAARQACMAEVAVAARVVLSSWKLATANPAPVARWRFLVPLCPLVLLTAKALLTLVRCP